MSDRPELAQTFRYVVGGGVTFVLEYASFLAFRFGALLEVHLSLLLSWLLALAAGFAINHLWTFERSDARVRRRFWAYTALALVNLAFNQLGVPELGRAGVPLAVAKIVAQVCVVAWNYVIMSRLIFRADRPQKA